MRNILYVFFSFFLVANLCAQVPIQFYDFEDNNNRSIGETTAEIIINSITGSEIISMGGTLSSAAGNPGSGSALQISDWDENTASDPGISAQDYFQFSANSDGFEGISITADIKGSATLQGPTGNINLLYSSDGGANFNASTPQTLSIDYQNYSWDLSTITSLNNNTQLIFRIYAYGDITGSGTVTIDNLTINALTITKSKVLGNYQKIDDAVSSFPGFADFTINGGGIEATLASDIIFNGTLTLSDGIFTTGSHKVKIALGGSISGSASSYINGNLSIFYDGDSFKDFHTGSLSAYRKINILIDASSGSGYVNLKQIDSAPSGNVTASGVNNISSVRYWSVIKDGSLDVNQSTIQISWGSDDGVTDYPNLIGVFGTEGVSWTQSDVTENPEGSNSSGHLNAVYQFGLPNNFTLGNKTGGGNPLPVELTYFKTLVKNKDVILNWRTETEINSFQFSIERKNLQENDWKEIEKIAAAGNSNKPNNYFYTDKNLLAGSYLYRLKMTDTDGSFEYSKEILAKIDPPKNFQLLQNYPNPFNPTTTIIYSVPQNLPNGDALVQLKIYDILGNEAATLVDKQQLPGRYEVKFDASKFANGMYFYQLTINNGQFSSIKKMIHLK